MTCQELGRVPICAIATARWRCQDPSPRLALEHRSAGAAQPAAYCFYKRGSFEGSGIKLGLGNAAFVRPDIALARKMPPFAVRKAALQYV